MRLSAARPFMSKPHSRSDDNAASGRSRGRQSEERRREHTTEVQWVNEIENVSRAGEHFETQRGLLPDRRPSVDLIARWVLRAPLPEAQTPCQGQIEVLRRRAACTVATHSRWSLVRNSVAIGIGSHRDGVRRGGLSAEIGPHTKSANQIAVQPDVHAMPYIVAARAPLASQVEAVGRQ